MSVPSLYADFMNADPLGRVRLNCAGTVEDLDRLGMRLAVGQRVTLHDDELEADGEAMYSDAEQLWVARIDWNALRPVASPATPHHV